SPDLPSLLTALDSETCVKKGRCPMIRADSSQKPRSLYYEIHGDLQASQKVVMTMHFTCSAWASQVQFFSRKKDHSVLVFDNRGTGNSELSSSNLTIFLLQSGRDH
ncbi:hypothetical protein MJO28_011317, partial [Puccinia striiformis f. sp. tritici]